MIFKYINIMRVIKGIHLVRSDNVKMVHYLLNCTAPLMQHEKRNGKERRVEQRVYIGIQDSKKKLHCTNQLEQVFPEVLCHEAEEGEEGPAEVVVAGVSIIWIPSHFHTHVTLRTHPVNITQQQLTSATRTCRI